jgi:hypothetical protein
MHWTDLDHELRGTGADPQALADARGITIVCDDAAAQAGGACWFGTAAPADKALADYRASGGTVSGWWAPMVSVHQRQKTAIHEAGHTVAHIRLGIGYGHTSILPDHEQGFWGRASGEGVRHVESEREAGDMVLAFCAGYGALRAAGYPDDVATDGAGGDFAKAHELMSFWLLPGGLDDWKARAVELMRKPENVAAVAFVVPYLQRHGRIEPEDFDVLVEVADGNITQGELQRYLACRGLA